MNAVNIINTLIFAVAVCGVVTGGRTFKRQETAKAKSIGVILLTGCAIAISASNWSTYPLIGLALLIILLLIHTIATKFKSNTTKNIFSVLWLILMFTVVFRIFQNG